MSQQNPTVACYLFIQISQIWQAPTLMVAKMKGVNLQFNHSFFVSLVIPLFDIADPVREEIGFKLEKDLFVECDTIDGMVVTESCIGLKQCFILMELFPLYLDSFIHDYRWLGTVCCQKRTRKCNETLPSFEENKKNCPFISWGYWKRQIGCLTVSSFRRALLRWLQ